MKKLIVALLLISMQIFSQEKTIQLPGAQTEIGMPLMQALKLRSSSRVFDTKPLPLQELSNLLWAACGVNRLESGKRTSPSARNWQEVDAYVVLENAAYVYDAKESSLKLISVGDLRALCGIQEFVKAAPLNLVYVADFSRIKSNDSEQTKLIWTSATAGFMVQNVYLYAASQGLNVVVRGLIDVQNLGEALKLKPEQKIILAQTVGYPK
ncbi:MAG: nitroreductase [Ignavibacteria bacterium]|nr:MAG: nitroreductase [Ignavibacteria bacterium]KAF0156704.1 MAG: nitroreductase [Ignavibacteria bacterium]